VFRRRLPRAVSWLTALFALLIWTPLTTPAGAAPIAPRPTSTGVSPTAPDPHPPAGGKAPDGSVPGGDHLASRGTVVPPGAPPLPKQIGARAWLLADLDTGEILAARDPHGRYQPASILKVLTAITMLGHLPGNRVVTVSPEAAGTEGSAVGLLPGGRYTVDELFDAMMLVSGNDAATALAEANGGVAATVAEMNSEAAALGAYDTYAQTPSGLDGWQQLTSAYDMALVLQQAVRQPRLIAYDRQPEAGFPPRSSKYGRVGRYGFLNQNNDFLTTVPGALLAKSGYTDAAQHTYLAAARRNGHTLGVVLLRNSRLPLDQYQQAGALLNWGFALPTGAQPIGRLAGSTVTNPPLPRSSLGTALAMASGRTATVDYGGWTILIPITAAVAGGLWLGCVALGGRRLLLRQGSRQP
jgi:serine-type D-Ala-D-Ala carboxypeptidase (penicillin-binding protein 5/6)